MTKDTILHKTVQRLVRNLRTPVRFGAYSSSLRYILCRIAFFFFLMMTAGVGNIWGQVTDGIYYIKIGDIYLWRAITEKTSGQPYLSGLKATSFNQTFNNATYNSVTYNGTYSFNSAHCTWVIKQVENTSYYTLINVGTNQYVVWDHYTSGTGRAVHLEERNSAPTESSQKCFYSIYKNGDNYYIFPDQCTTDNALGFNYKNGWNDNDKLRQRNNQGGGLIQFYSGTSCSISGASLLPAPTISDVDVVTNKVIVTDNSSLPSGYNVRYTFSSDGTPPANPTASSSIMPSDGLEISVKGILKVVIERYGVVLTSVATKNVKPANQCEKPVIVIGDHVFTITCSYPTSGVNIYYTTDNNVTAEELAENPAANGTLYPDGGVSFSEYGFVVKAVAAGTGFITSEVATQYIGAPLSGEGTEASPYLIKSDNDFSTFVGYANSPGGVSGAHYRLMTNINGGDEITIPFTGTFESGADSEGNFYKISGLNHALFNSLDGGTVRNVMLDNVSVSGDGNVGSICNEATGASRIYNCGVLATDSEYKTNENGYTEITDCSSTVGGSGYVGGIVGFLDGSSRVINCFSYANITSGNEVGGIVGRNNVATTSANPQTMVMNCMFYGDIIGGSSKAPVYNGLTISNRSDESGVSNFNYFWAGASYVQEQNIDVYNCALSAETRFLQRFEFFRPLLNSNRALAAWWATGDRTKKDQMLKWVLDPSQIGTSTPYPILKPFAKYPSVVNIDAANAESFDDTNKKLPYNKGRKFGQLTINIQMGTDTDVAGNIKAAGAEITTKTVTPNITDKDPAHFNFNYYKVQLPYYNDVGTNNYRKANASDQTSRVVTGWKIVSISGGINFYSTDNDNNEATPADAEAEVDANGDITLTTPFNFADRHCTDKDLFSVSGRVFNQGAYFDVPEGVTSITIEPYWAKCVYVSDQYLDVVYNQVMSTASPVTATGGGTRYTNGNTYSINGDNQKVYTTIGNAITALNPSGSVYDNAIVLVGNVHYYVNTSNKATDHSNPYTIMSIDLDKDNEPDYSYIFRLDGRVRVHPVRVDFLNVIGLGMAQKSNGGTGTYNIGIMQPKDWFEVTNTGLFRVTQFEYDFDGRTMSPIILQGGVIEQWVTVGGKEETIVAADAVSYYHVGGNVWFKEFHIGVHQDKIQPQFVSPHPPISVSGGDYDIFYLTGYYNSPNNNFPDNAECYINGGRFNKVAGTGMQGIGKAGGADNTGNIIWQIDHADINEFYGGGINAAHISEGDIITVISNSRVDQFCGGPKFGNMNNSKKVVTNASNCTFRTFFGAGYGGNSYNRYYPTNKNNLTEDPDWNGWLANGNTGENPFAGYKNSYIEARKGVEARIDYQYLPMSNNTQNVARLFVDYVSFSLATTYDVTSKLTGCTITKSPLGTLDLFEGCIGNFYGGGSLGKVGGPVKSTLTNCTVEGNVFGAGYSASTPKVSVMANTFQIQPRYDKNLGAYLDAKLPATKAEYEWKPQTNSSVFVDNTNHILYTKAEDLEKSNLGSVNGDVTLILTTSGTNGKTTIGIGSDNTTGNVYGGGDASYVTGDSHKITVNLQGKTEVLGNVYGGGNEGIVEGSTEVNIQD